MLFFSFSFRFVVGWWFQPVQPLALVPGVLTTENITCPGKSCTPARTESVSEPCIVQKAVQSQETPGAALRVCLFWYSYKSIFNLVFILNYPCHPSVYAGKVRCIPSCDWSCITMPLNYNAIGKQVRMKNKLGIVPKLRNKYEKYTCIFFKLFLKQEIY